MGILIGMMFVVLFICLIMLFIVLPIMGVRNRWTFEVRTKYVHLVYAYNLELLDKNKRLVDIAVENGIVEQINCDYYLSNKIDDVEDICKSYDEIYKTFWIWDEEHFITIPDHIDMEIWEKVKKI